MTTYRAKPQSLRKHDTIIIDGQPRKVGQESVMGGWNVWSSYRGKTSLYHDGGVLTVDNGMGTMVQTTEDTYLRIKADTDRFNARHGCNLVLARIA